MNNRKYIKKDTKVYTLKIKVSLKSGNNLKLL